MHDDLQTTSLNDALTKSFYLTPEDIEANRDGTVSDRQIARVLGQMRAVWMGVGCFALLTTAPLLLLLIILSNTFIRIILIASIAAWLFGFLMQSRKIRAQHKTVQEDLSAGKALMIEGNLTKKSLGKAGLFFIVENIEFQIPEAIFNAAPVDERFIVYYLPQSQHLLSMEAVQEMPVFIDENQTV